MALVKRRATYADLAAQPDILVAEMVDGDLFTSPRPAAPHARATTRLVQDLAGFDGPPAGDRGGWWILVEPELHLGADVLVPDLAGWRHARMPEVPNVAAFTLVPDWVCETLSPGTVTWDRTRKMRVYARAGVPHAWLLDPLARLVEIHELGAGSWRLAAAHVGDAPFAAEPFATLTLDPSRWWLPGTRAGG